ncbi:hypothetical protein LH494_27405, partial [Klebsiella pneumoniae]|uniref:hypothetical protein n=1 Tax=Klebsiella pneumoniae TaxID=573 RepID=UPI001E4FD48F
IDYRDYDPDDRGNHEQRIDDLEAKTASATVDAIPVGGNLPGGQVRYHGAWLVPPTLTAATDATLKQLGIEYEAQVASGDGGAYFRVNLDDTQKFGNGDYVVGSVLIRKSPGDAWSMLAQDVMSISTVQANGAQPQS